tara:strand:+ start:12092 stop:13342 length:1251 start_codon:yes stop_codon:yes gene_type:complete
MKWNRHILILIFPLPCLFGQKFEKLAYNKYLVTSIQTLESTIHGGLIIKNFRGDITVSGDVAQEVRIIRRSYLNVNSTENAERLLKKVGVTITAESTDDNAKSIIVESLNNKTRHLSDNLEITVPNIFSVAIQNRGGDLNIDQVQGEIDIATSGGDIDLKSLSGKITAHTSGGNVEGIDISGRVSVSTSGGSIEFEGLKGELKGETHGGDVKGEKIQGSVTLKTSGGEIDLYDVVGREIYGQTNAGDVIAREIIATSTIDFHTNVGNIDLEDITGDLEASTSGGDIEIKHVRGSVKVWTSGGEIDAELVRGAFDGRTSAGNITLSKIWDRQYEDHEIDVKTSAGDIDLTLPKDFPADLDLRVLSLDRDPGGAILSDFPVTISSSRNMSKGKGRSGDGRFDVHMEASVGTIKVRQEK